MGTIKTGIVMMNLGGPADLDQVEPFLLELFADREIIQLPFQRWLGPYIARRRTPKVKRLYANIGGGSPILRYTEAQGRGMIERLDRLSPETAPHQFYVAFRYVRPKSEDALRAMKADGVRALILEPWGDRKLADRLAAETGVKVVLVAPGAGAVKGTEAYLDWIAYNVNAIAQALR